MDNKSVFEILDSKHHHNLYYSGWGVNLVFDEQNFLTGLNDTADNYFSEKPGFWFSLSENKKIIRCGTHTNIKHKINSFERINGEEEIYANESVKDGEIGMKDMKRIKQEFKRLLIKIK